MNNIWWVCNLNQFAFISIISFDFAALRILFHDGGVAFLWDTRLYIWTMRIFVADKNIIYISETDFEHWSISNFPNSLCLGLIFCIPSFHNVVIPPNYIIEIFVHVWKELRKWKILNVTDDACVPCHWKTPEVTCNKENISSEISPHLKKSNLINWWELALKPYEIKKMLSV